MGKHEAGRPARYLRVSCGQLATLVVLVTVGSLLWKGHDPDLTSTQVLSLALRRYQAAVLMPSYSNHFGQPLGVQPSCLLDPDLHVCRHTFAMTIASVL